MPIAGYVTEELKNYCAFKPTSRQRVVSWCCRFRDLDKSVTPTWRLFTFSGIENYCYRLKLQTEIASKCELNGVKSRRSRRVVDAREDERVGQRCRRQLCVSVYACRRFGFDLCTDIVED